MLLEQNARALSTLLLDFLILMCSFIYRGSSELVDRRYDSQNVIVNALFVFSRDFLAQFKGMTFLLLKCSRKQY